MIKFKNLSFISLLIIAPIVTSCTNNNLNKEIITKLEISNKNSTIEVNKVYKFEVKTDKSNPNIDLKWSTSNIFISSIDEDSGEFKAKNVGKTTIKVVDNISKLEASLEISIIEGIEEINSSSKFLTLLSSKAEIKESDMPKVNYSKKHIDTSYITYEENYEYFHYNDNSSIENYHYKGKRIGKDETIEDNITLKYIENNQYYEVCSRNTKNDYLFIYDINDDEEGYGIITTIEALNKVNNPNYISSINVTELNELKTFSEESFTSNINDNKLFVKGNSYYLKTYPNGEDKNLCEYFSYEVEATFLLSGELLNLNFETKFYNDYPYDFDKEELKPTAIPNTTTIITYEATLGELLDSNNKIASKDDYFVKNIFKATYNKNNTIKKGETLTLNDLIINEFAPISAIDVTNQYYEIYSDESDKFSFVKQNDGTYKAVSLGKEKITFKNIYSDIKFDIEIEVVE